MLNRFFSEGKHSAITALVRAQIYKIIEFFQSTGGHAPFPVKTHPNFLKKPGAIFTCFKHCAKRGLLIRQWKIPIIFTPEIIAVRTGSLIKCASECGVHSWVVVWGSCVPWPCQEVAILERCWTDALVRAVLALSLRPRLLLCLCRSEGTC